MRIHEFSYRYADSVLTHAKFRDAYQHLLEVLRDAPVPLLEANGAKGGVKSRRRAKPSRGVGSRIFFLPVDQKAINRYLDGRLTRAAGWDPQPLIVRERPGELEAPDTKIKGDYKRNGLQVEVQFGNMARWYSDVFKFQLGYSRQDIDVGVLVVPTISFANLIDENVACYERVKRELPFAKMSLTLPIMVLGVEPEDYGPVRERYRMAFEVETAKSPDAKLELIPFESRIAEPPSDSE